MAMPEGPVTSIRDRAFPCANFSFDVSDCHGVQRDGGKEQAWQA
jgi:hypothetical protein